METIYREKLSEAKESPLKKFLRISSNGGMMLLFVGIIALLWANSPWQDIYTFVFEECHMGFSFNDAELNLHLLHWINDGLMAIFFLMVGMEIKRELYCGELSNLKDAALPIFGAIGGMVVPMLIYMSFGLGDNAAHGWGIPMATDIAFSIGILSLLGNRVPLVLKVFLTALAIVDDLGGVLVIAMFYTQTIQWTYLLIGLGLVALLFVCNYLCVYRLTVYLVVGVIVWWFFLQSGIHSTIAGVLVAFTIPMRTRIESSAFVDGVREALPKFDSFRKGVMKSVVLSQEQLQSMTSIYRLSRSVASPLQFLESKLHKLVNYIVLPLFALSNSGVMLYNFAGEQPELMSMVTVAVAASLFVGKTVGISLFSWLAVRMGFASKPHGVSWHSMIGVAMMGGIGFTMSLFISSLAFSDPDVVAQAKLGIFIGSILSGFFAYQYLRLSLKKDVEHHVE